MRRSQGTFSALQNRQHTGAHIILWAAERSWYKWLLLDVFGSLTLDLENHDWLYPTQYRLEKSLLEFRACLTWINVFKSLCSPEASERWEVKKSTGLHFISVLDNSYITLGQLLNFLVASSLWWGGWSSSSQHYRSVVLWKRKLAPGRWGCRSVWPTSSV